MELKIVLSFITLFGVVATAFVTWLIAQRRLMGEHVTAERTKWRKKIRKKALEVHDVIVSGKIDEALKLQNEFRVLLNPFDQSDHEILRCIDAKGSEADRESRARDFARSISLLLKHDWDRAKLEAGLFPSRWFVKAKRISLECAYGKNGICCSQTSRLNKQFEIKWKKILAFAGLFFPVIVGLIVMWFMVLGIVCSHGLKMTLQAWGNVPS